MLQQNIVIEFKGLIAVSKEDMNRLLTILTGAVQVARKGYSGSEFYISEKPKEINIILNPTIKEDGDENI